MNAPVAQDRPRLGRVLEYRPTGRAPRWRIDFGRRWSARYLYSFRGGPLDTRELAEAVLAFIETQVARGRAVDDVLGEVAPEVRGATSIEPLLRRWLVVFGKRVETGSRQPRTFEEYSRWAEPNGHFSFWFPRGLHEVDRASLEEWSFWLSDRGLGGKTIRNVMAGFRSFLSWVSDHSKGFLVPRFPWPEVDEHQPIILRHEIQWKILMGIPWPRAGIFFAMAQCLIRPSEARALRVRDWMDDEIRVSRAAKDKRVGGVVRGLKSRNQKVLPIGGEPLAMWLDEHVSAERRLADPDGPLFLNPDAYNADGRWAVGAMRRAWAKACADAGVAGVSLYTGTKHSTATHLKGLGADDRVLAQLMGHRDLRSVTRYAKLSPSAIDRAMRRLYLKRDEEK